MSMTVFTNQPLLGNLPLVAGIVAEQGAILLAALLIGAALAIVVARYYFTSISRVLLFWLVFVLTRPFGTTFGDLLTKSPEGHGLGFGTPGSSLNLLGLLVALVVYDRLGAPAPGGLAYR